MRISDCEFKHRFGFGKVELRLLSNEFAIRNPQFEIYYAA